MLLVSQASPPGYAYAMSV